MCSKKSIIINFSKFLQQSWWPIRLPWKQSQHCAETFLGGCTRMSDCMYVDCTAASDSFNAQCYNGPASQKEVNGCTNFQDCLCRASTPNPDPEECTADLLGGCMSAEDCFGPTECVGYSPSYVDDCYNGDLSEKINYGCGDVKLDCMCPP